MTYHDDEHASASAFGLGVGWYPTDGGSYVLNEPDGARSWLPSNDHPSDKATWRFELTVPEGVTAVANGHLVEQRPVERRHDVGLGAARPDGDLPRCRC